MKYCDILVKLNLQLDSASTFQHSNWTIILAMRPILMWVDVFFLQYIVNNAIAVAGKRSEKNSNKHSICNA